MKFPTRKNDLLTLARTLADGLTAHAEAFSNPEFAPDDLAAMLDGLATTQARRQLCLSLLKQAIAEEQEQLRQLTAAVRKRLNLAEAMYREQPDRLMQIGWGPRRPRTFNPPNQPRDLVASRRGSGRVELRWKPPKRAVSGRSLRFYRIERRRMEPGEDWRTDQVYATTEPRMVLSDQPSRVELEYRVIAVNPHGDSPPTNTAAIVT